MDNNKCYNYCNFIELTSIMLILFLSIHFHVKNNHKLIGIIGNVKIFDSNGLNFSCEFFGNNPFIVINQKSKYYDIIIRRNLFCLKYKLMSIFVVLWIIIYDLIRCLNNTFLIFLFYCIIMSYIFCMFLDYCVISELDIEESNKIVGTIEEMTEMFEGSHVIQLFYKFRIFYLRNYLSIKYYSTDNIFYFTMYKTFVLFFIISHIEYLFHNETSLYD